MASRRIENNWGSADSFLNAVPYSNNAIPSDAVSKAAPRDQKEFAKLLVDSMHQCFADSALYIKETESRVVDVVMGRMASLLDEVKATFLADELQSIKEQIIASLNSSDVDASDKQEISDELKTLFSNVTTKEELNDLKDWLQNAEYNNDSEEPPAESETDESAEDVTEDETSGEYKDSTVALNFTTLQNFIQSQVDQINENLKNIPGQSGLLSMAGTLGSIASGVASVSKLIGSKAILGITKTIAGISAGVGVAIAGVGLAIKGVKSIGSGIKKGFGAIGRGIAAPFKKVGSMFSALNPFKRRDNARNEKNEAKKQALRDKVMNLIGKIIDKMWKYIEPFIDKVGIFMSLVTKTVVIPIALIALKVALIVAAIVAIGIGLYLAYNWVKKKIGEFIDYVFSGQLWEDIKTGLSSMWEWAKDFGGYLWNKLVDFGKWLLIDMPLALLKLLFVQFPIWIWNQLTRFGIWIWDKLCEFGNWLYDTYIDPYIIQPLTKLIQPIANLWVEKIQPKIQPFIDSLLKLKDMIVGIFKGWDTSKSFWENLKNMTKLIKEGVLQWWEESPFKVFYEQRIEPFIVSACELFLKLKDLGGTIKKAILDWWNGDSSLGETLTNIGTTIKNAVVEWWDTSVFKTFWDETVVPLIDKIKVYFQDLLKPLKDWYKSSGLENTINNIVDFLKLYIAAPIMGLKTYLTRAFVNLADKLWIPKINMDWGKYSKLSPISSLKKVFSFEKLYPLKDLVTDDMRESAAAAEDKSLQEIINEEMSKMQKNIEDKSNVKVEPEVKPPDSKQSHEIVMQNIGAAAEPIKSIDNMKTQNNTELQRTSEAVATEVEADKRKDAIYKDNTNAMLQNLANGLDALHGDVNKYGKDPSAIPVPVPVGPTRNSAMMGEN